MQRFTHIENHWTSPSKTPYTFIDLFCGAGGLSLGLQMAGLNGVCGLDCFKEAGETYSHNFNHAYINGDIKTTKNQLYDTVHEALNDKELDIVAGGFPCQGFSMAGKRKSNDPRNKLYRELVDVVNTLQPKIVIGENVKGIWSMDGGAVIEAIRDDFMAIGYKIDAVLLNAADYYVPQKRERVIFIGNRIKAGKHLAPNIYPYPILNPHQFISVGEAIGDFIDAPTNPDFNHVPSKHTKDMVERMNGLKEGEALYPDYKETAKRLYWDKPAWTMKENHGSTSIHPKLPRTITAREMARIQSFPDNFIFKGPKSKQLVQIGNAVPPLLAKAVGLSVTEMLTEYC